MKDKVLEILRLGRVEYGEALAFQKKLETSVIENPSKNFLVLLEHPHTYTLGRRGDRQGILATPERLESRGVKVFETNRGGKITYHGLGQLVAYPIISLSPDREDVQKYVRDLEMVLIRALADLGIDAFGLKNLTGVHTKQGKIAAIGVHIKRWVTTHGFGLNVNTDLSYYDWIISCEGEPVTTIEQILGRESEISAIENLIVKHFADVFGFAIINEHRASATQTL